MKSGPMDVEMPDLTNKAAEDKKKQILSGVISKDDKQSAPLEDMDSLTIEDIKQQIRLIEKGVLLKDSRFIQRVVRSLTTIRKRLNNSVLRRLVNIYVSQPNFASRDSLLKVANELFGFQITPAIAPTSLSSSTAATNTNARQSASNSPGPVLPEVEVYLYLLLLLLLLDSKNYTAAVACGDRLLGLVGAENRRSLDLLAAKAYFYVYRAHELCHPDALHLLREELHARLRSATLHNDHEGQAVLVNLLLRNLLGASLFELAEKLVSKLTFPEQASNAQWARYMFYMGQLKAVQLDYTEAHRHLLSALRKSPQSARIAAGFKQTVHKWAVVVQLLLGEIPDRAQFRQPVLKRSLDSYLKITLAVREGSLKLFSEALAANENRFLADGTYSLISRLRHNVIKTGVRLLSISYSRIRLDTVAAKLQLENAEDVEFIVAKAIRDGVIEASICHEGGYLQSHLQADVYATWEAAGALQERTRFCLDLAKSSTRAMRYPARRYRDPLETEQERRQREQIELDTARDLQDEFDDVI